MVLSLQPRSKLTPSYTTQSLTHAGQVQLTRWAPEDDGLDEMPRIDNMARMQAMVQVR
jgi:hypothetical protein